MKFHFLSVENDDLETNDNYGSMDLEAAKGRVLDPESIVIGGNFGKSMKQISRSSEMFMHVPPTTLRGMEDFVEELDYYQTYEKVVGIPVEIVKEPLIPWPEMLEVMTFPTGNVEHFQQPRRYSKFAIIFLCNSFSLKLSFFPI